MKIFFVSEPTQISTPFFVRGGGFFTSSSRGKDDHERKGRDDDDDDDDDDARARTIPFSSGLSVDSSIGEDTRERDALRGGQRAKKDKRIDPAHLFCVQQNDFDKKKRRERGQEEGFFLLLLLLENARETPSPLSRSWNRVRKTALLVPSPSIDGVAECGVLCFVSRFLFLEKPKQKKGVDIFSQKEEDVQKKKKR